MYGINGGIVKIPSVKFDEPIKDKKGESAYRQIRLSSERDYMYEMIRGLPLFGAKAVLKAKGK